MTTRTIRGHEIYEVVGSGIDHNGWFKFHLLRDDGREIKVTRARLKELRRRDLIQETSADGVREDGK